MDRENAIEDLTEGSIKVLFTVDMFNEGVDVRAIDMVMFLRPTESPTVFIQQLGRGLRTSEGKTHLTVLDFIGNYRNVDMIPALLTGMRTLRVSTIGDIDNKLPPGCFVDFDLGSLDLFERMRLRDRKLKDLIRDEYIRVKDSIGHVPTRMEFYSSIDPEILSRSKGSMFKDYLGFIDEMDDLDPIRRSFIDAPAGRFINMIEKTSMSKLYKMPILLAFFKETDIKMVLDERDIIDSFREFYSRDNNIIDMKSDSGKKNIDSWSDDKWLKLANTQPIHFLCKTESRFFSIPTNGSIALDQSLETYSGLKVFRDEVIDAIALRTIDFKEKRYREGHNVY